MPGFLTSLRQWWGCAAQGRRGKRDHRPRVRLGLEALEGRSVPSVTTGWSTAAGGTAVAADSSGNVYAIASYPAGGSGTFVTKYSRSGAFQWATALTQTGSAGSSDDIAADSTGTSVYVTGTNYDPSTGLGYGFVTQLNAVTGVVSWTQNSTSQQGGGIGGPVAVDSSGYVYVAMDLNNPTITKYDVNGNQQWQATITNTSFVQPTSIATSGSSVFIAGRAAGTVTFVTGSGKSSFSAPGECGFVAKLTSSDQYAWGKSFGGNSKKNVGIVWDCNVGADSAGNAYAYGQFIGSVNFGNNHVLNGGSGAVNDGAAYVVKLNSAGTTVWAEEFGYSTTSTNYIEPPDYGTGSIAVDSSGNIYMTGYYEGTVSFNPAGGGYLSGGGGYVVKLDTNGNYQWAVNAGNTGNNALAVDGLGDIYLTANSSGNSLWQLTQA